MGESTNVARTYRLDLAYDGTAYAGFGIQPNESTVQEVLERAIAAVVGHPARVTPAGRTDRGVHAVRQTVSVRLEPRDSVRDLARAVTAHLPADIVVTRSAVVDDRFDARRDAIARHYCYLIFNAQSRPLWTRSWCWHVLTQLDVGRMRVAAASVLGEHDFAAFHGRAAESPAGVSTRRIVTMSRVELIGPWLRYDVTANAFLRRMVRSLVGTLVAIGSGRLEPEVMSRALRSQDRSLIGATAPAQGLFLVRAAYPGDAEHATINTRLEEADVLPFGPLGLALGRGDCTS